MDLDTTKIVVAAVVFPLSIWALVKLLHRSRINIKSINDNDFYGYEIIDTEYKERGLVLPKPLNPTEANKIIDLIKSENWNFKIFDELYPSPSDLGGYLTYSRTKAADNDQWAMSIGNHGWGGGTYQIKETVIVQQICHLAQHGYITCIDLDDKPIMNYPVKTANQSNEMNLRLDNLHKG